MRKIIYLFFFLLGSLLKSQIHPGVNQLNISHLIDDQEVIRTVYVKTPMNFSSNNIYPIVFVFHGGGGTDEHFLHSGFFNFLTDSKEFIGIYPNGYSDNPDDIGGHWNLGNEPSSANDLEFVDLIFQEIESFSFINFDKVFAIGMSNGAGMVNLLGKSRSYFDGIAPLFSQQLVTIGELETLYEPLKVFQVVGQNDESIPINGGTSFNGEFMSALNSAQNWAENLNCDISYITEENIFLGSTDFYSTTYSTCNNSQSEIKSLIAINTGHNWNNPQTEIAVLEEIWDFFNTSHLEINKIQSQTRKIISVFDILGRECSTPIYDGLYFYLYSDGSFEKKIIVDEN